VLFRLCSLANVLTSWITVLLEKLVAAQLFKKYVYLLYGSLIAVLNRFFTGSCVKSLNESSIFSNCTHIYPEFSQVVSFFHIFRPEILWALFFSHLSEECSAHLIFLKFISLIISGVECRLLTLSLSRFLYPPVTYTHLGPNILLSFLFSNCFNLYSF
jgi:hypothetical protein